MKLDAWHAPGREGVVICVKQSGEPAANWTDFVPTDQAFNQLRRSSNNAPSEPLRINYDAADGGFMQSMQRRATDEFPAEGFSKFERIFEKQSPGYTERLLLLDE